MSFVTWAGCELRSLIQITQRDRDFYIWFLCDQAFVRYSSKRQEVKFLLY
ncbi:hypothetical protein [Hydrococcus rivularis]|nr:hypothetical protein [Hydrococcus rivularis]